MIFTKKVRVRLRRSSASVGRHFVPNGIQLERIPVRCKLIVHGSNKIRIVSRRRRLGRGLCGGRAQPLLRRHQAVRRCWSTDRIRWSFAAQPFLWRRQADSQCLRTAPARSRAVSRGFRRPTIQAELLQSVPKRIIDQLWYHVTIRLRMIHKFARLPIVCHAQSRFQVRDEALIGHWLEHGPAALYSTVLYWCTVQ